MKIKILLFIFLIGFSSLEKLNSQELIAPIDFKELNEDFHFVWDDTMTEQSKYLFEITEDTSFSDIEFTIILEESEIVLPADIFRELTTYFWRVRKMEENMIWSDIGQFKTGVLTSITLISPENNLEAVDLNPKFKFSSDDSNSLYFYQVAEDSLFSIIFEEGIVNKMDFQLNNSLKESKIYYWRVRKILEIKEPKKYRVRSIENSGGRVLISDTLVEEGRLIYVEAIANEGYYFTGWKEFGNERRIPLIVNEDIFLEPSFEADEVIGLQIKNPIDTLVISNKYRYNVDGIFVSGKIIDITDSVVITSVDSNITVMNSNEFVSNKSGKSFVEIGFKNLKARDLFYSYEIEIVPVDSIYTSKGDCIIEVPVIFLNLFPTKDGLTHDSENGPLSYWGDLNDIPLIDSKKKVYETLRLDRDIVEYGTRYRDYGEQTSDPYACIKVEKIINVYEWRLVPWINNLKTLDYNDLFQRVNLEKYVNFKGVKEVWITYFPIDAYPGVINSDKNDPKKYWGMPESNMASPLTGDISNSYRIQDDLPIYNSTYVVYGNSGHRGTDTDMHNRGHQIEAQLSYLDAEPVGDKLFWNKFVGVQSNDQSKNGRCGNTHFPPNAESDYDYCSYDPILSDIKNWIPNGGKEENVDCSDWLNIEYPFDLKAQHINYISNYNVDPHTKWLLFWFQSIPGLNNNIPFQKNGKENKISNWWDLFYNWDEAVKNRKTLWE